MLPLEVHGTLKWQQHISERFFYLLVYPAEAMKLKFYYFAYYHYYSLLPSILDQLFTSI